MHNGQHWSVTVMAKHSTFCAPDGTDRKISFPKKKALMITRAADRVCAFEKCMHFLINFFISLEYLVIRKSKAQKIKGFVQKWCQHSRWNLPRNLGFISRRDTFRWWKSETDGIFWFGCCLHFLFRLSPLNFFLWFWMA